jgi:hypothetical protein
MGKLELNHSLATHQQLITPAFYFLASELTLQFLPIQTKA